MLQIYTFSMKSWRQNYTFSVKTRGENYTFSMGAAGTGRKRGGWEMALGTVRRSGGMRLMFVKVIGAGFKTFLQRACFKFKIGD